MLWVPIIYRTGSKACSNSESEVAADSLFGHSSDPTSLLLERRPCLSWHVQEKSFKGYMTLFSSFHLKIVPLPRNNSWKSEVPISALEGGSSFKFSQGIPERVRHPTVLKSQKCHITFKGEFPTSQARNGPQVTSPFEHVSEKTFLPSLVANGAVECI